MERGLRVRAVTYGRVIRERILFIFMVGAAATVLSITALFRIQAIPRPGPALFWVCLIGGLAFLSFLTVVFHIAVALKGLHERVRPGEVCRGLDGELLGAGTWFVRPNDDPETYVIPLNGEGTVEEGPLRLGYSYNVEEPESDEFRDWIYSTDGNIHSYLEARFRETLREINESADPETARMGAELLVSRIVVAEAVNSDIDVNIVEISTRLKLAGL